MANRKNKVMGDTTVVRSFAIDGITYTDGDKLQVITPELGLIPVVLKFESHSTASLPAMDFGYIRTPLPCRMNKQPDSPNATLHFSSYRMPAFGSSPEYRTNTLRLVYFCLCDSRKHTPNLVWRECSFETGIIRSKQTAEDAALSYRRVVHPLVASWQQLEPTTYEELKQEPIQAGKHGQFNLF